MAQQATPVTVEQVHNEGIDGMLKYLRKFKASDEAGNAADAWNCPVKRYYEARLNEALVAVNSKEIRVVRDEGDEYFSVEGQWEDHVQGAFFQHGSYWLTVGQVRRDLKDVKKQMEAGYA